MNTFTPTVLENGVSPPPRGDRPGGKGEDFAEAFYGAVDGLPPTPASEPPPRRGPEAIETPEPSKADSRDARVANLLCSCSQDGQGAFPALEGGTEGSASATTAMAKASRPRGHPVSLEASQRTGKENAPVSLGVRDARIGTHLRLGLPRIWARRLPRPWKVARRVPQAPRLLWQRLPLRPRGHLKSLEASQRTGKGKRPPFPSVLGTRALRTHLGPGLPRN